MTHTTYSFPPRTTTDEPTVSAARRRHAADAVVAAYINDIAGTAPRLPRATDGDRAERSAEPVAAAA